MSNRPMTKTKAIRMLSSSASALIRAIGEVSGGGKGRQEITDALFDLQPVLERWLNDPRWKDAPQDEPSRIKRRMAFSDGPKT